MTSVKIDLEMDAAESLLGVLRDSKIPGEMRAHLIRIVENGIRESSQPGSAAGTPPYVGEHGEADR